MTTGTPASAAKAAAAAPPAINPLDDPNIMSRGWRRFVHLSSYVVCAGAAFYLVFEQDFGPGEHVFSPLRRWYRQTLHDVVARPLPPSMLPPSDKSPRA